MTYGPANISRDLTLILEGSADFATRARLEHNLLMIVQSDGIEALGDLLVALPDHRFAPSDEDSAGIRTRLTSRGPDSALLVVRATLDEDFATLDVSVLHEGESAAPPDASHQAFYEVWETLLGTPDSDVRKLDSHQRAVYLIGLLESEVMNGGFGQYLTNTGGAWIEETLEWLEQVGASETRALLRRAAALGAEYESFLEAWDERSADFGRLDEEFLKAGEDLAGLTANAVLSVE